MRRLLITHKWVPWVIQTQLIAFFVSLQLFLYICFDRLSVFPQLRHLNDILIKALSFFKKANELKADKDFKYQLAKAFYLKGQYSEALTTLPKSNRNYYVSELHSQILSDSGKYQESNEILLKLIKYRKKIICFDGSQSETFNVCFFRSAGRLSNRSGAAAISFGGCLVFHSDIQLWTLL